MPRQSIPRSIVAMAVAALGIMGPSLASSAAPVAHAWVDQPRDSAPAGLANSWFEGVGVPAAYDSALHVAMVAANVAPACNGCPAAALDIWTSSGSGWSDLGAAPNSAPCPLGPSCSGGLQIAYDPRRAQIVGVGPCVYGTPDLCTWTWSGGHTWTLAASTGFANTDAIAVAYDPTLAGTVMLACALSGTTCAPVATYLWNGSTWATITSTGPLPGPQTDVPFGTLAYDAARRDLIFVQQVSSTGGASLSTQTWALRGTTWTLLSPATNPPLALDMAYDPVERTIVAVIPSDGNQTWSWNGADWQRQTVVDSTAGGTLGSGIFALTYDTTRKAVIGLDSNLLGTMTAVYQPLV